MDSVTWEEPPPNRIGRSRDSGPVQKIVEALKTKPGEWALVYSQSPYYAKSNQPQGYTRLHGLGCEVTCRTNGDGTARVYARWPKEGS